MLNSFSGQTHNQDGCDESFGRDRDTPSSQREGGSSDKFCQIASGAGRAEAVGRTAFQARMMLCSCSHVGGPVMQSEDKRENNKAGYKRNH